MPNFDPIEIEQEIKDSLNAFGPVVVRKNYGTTDWTNRVKAIFGAIGHKRGYGIYSSFCNRNQGRLYSADQIRQHVQQMLGESYVVPN